MVYPTEVGGLRPLLLNPRATNLFDSFKQRGWYDRFRYMTHHAILKAFLTIPIHCMGRESNYGSVAAGWASYSRICVNGLKPVHFRASADHQYDVKALPHCVLPGLAAIIRNLHATSSAFRVAGPPPFDSRDCPRPAEYAKPRRTANEESGAIAADVWPSVPPALAVA